MKMNIFPYSASGCQIKRPTRPYILIIFITFLLIFLTRLHSSDLPSVSNSSLRPSNNHSKFSIWGSSARVSKQKIKHNRIFVASAFAAHFDVYLALAGAVQSVLDATYSNPSDYILKVYASLPLLYGFQDIVDHGDTGLYTGNITNNRNLLEDFKKAFEIGEDPSLLILGTCEIEYVFIQLTIRQVCLKVAQYAGMEQDFTGTLGFTS